MGFYGYIGPIWAHRGSPFQTTPNPKAVCIAFKLRVAIYNPKPSPNIFDGFPYLQTMIACAAVTVMDVTFSDTTTWLRPARRI